MIRLTDQNGKAVYISADSIVAVYDGGMATSIDIGAEEVYSVKESPSEVARKVLEYKLEFERHKVTELLLYENHFTVDQLHRVNVKSFSALRKLAGLEDTGGTIE